MFAQPKKVYSGDTLHEACAGTQSQASAAKPAITVDRTLEQVPAARPYQGLEVLLCHAEEVKGRSVSTKEASMT